MNRKLVVVAFVVASFGVFAQSAQAGSITIDNEPGRANGGVYTTVQLSGTSFNYAVIGNSGIPSGTPNCTMTVVGSSSTSAGPVACNSSPFSHSATPFAPGNRANWTGGYPLSTSLEGVWTFTVQHTIDSSPLSVSQSWSVDNTAPVINLASTPSLTNDSTPTLPFAIVDANPGSSYCAIHPSAYASAPSYVLCGSNTSYTHSTSLADGSYKFYVNHTDLTGEFSNQNSGQKSFTVDATGPTITVTLPTANQIFNTHTPSINLGAVDPAPNTGVTALDCRYDTDSFVDCNNSAITSANLPDGSHTLSVRATDGASNTTIVNRVFRIDTTIPTIALDAIPSPGNDNTPTFTFTPNDVNPGTSECRVYPLNTTPPAYGACTTATTFTTSALADGQWVVEVRHTDEAGNLGFASDAFTVDTVAPTITILSPQPGQVLETPVPELGLSAGDPDPGTGVATFQCAFDADALLLCGDDGFANRRLANGAHTLSTRATDNAGNVATAVVQFSVDSSLGDGSSLPSATAAKFKRLSSKVKKGKLRLLIRTTLTLPGGMSATAACNGRVRITVTGRLPRKKRKTFSVSVPLKPQGATCIATGTLSMPRTYKKRKLTPRASFNGNDTLGSFSLVGKLQ